MVKDSVSRVKKFQAEAQALLDEQGMVLVDEARLHPLRRFIHFWVLVGKSFVRNRCPVRASALAYTTLLALIPLLAVGLGVSTKLLQSSEDQQAELIQTVVDELAWLVLGDPRGEDESSQKVVETIRTFIGNVHSGALGLVGTVALVFVAIGLLSTIEATFNDIWGVPRGRNWFVRIIHYWAAV